METINMNNEKMIDMCNDALALEHDAIPAYEMTIEKLDCAMKKAKVTEFLGEHRRHVEELSRMVTSMGGKARTSGDMMKMMTTGKVMIADMIGDDKAILRAMMMNETATTEFYEKMSMETQGMGMMNDMMTRALADERKHKLWAEQTISEMEMNEKKAA